MRKTGDYVKKMNLGIPSTEIDIAICELVSCVSNFSDNHFDAFWLNLTEPEIEILVIKLISYLIKSLDGRLLMCFLLEARNSSDSI
jgi:hypothetical protein